MWPNITHIKDGITVLFADFDINQLRDNPNALKERFDTELNTRVKAAVESQVAEASKDAVEAAEKTAVETFSTELAANIGVVMIEGVGLEESILSALEAGKQKATDANTTLSTLCASLTDAGIAVSADAIPDKDKLAASIKGNVSKQAAHQLANSGHNPVAETPTKTSGDVTGRGGSSAETILSELDSIADPIERAKFRSKHFGKIKEAASKA